MIRVFYIVILFYAPILGMFMPSTNFGAGIPDIDIVRFLFYIFLMVTLMEISYTKKGLKIFSRWIAILCIFSSVVFASISWSNYSYGFYIFQELSWKVLAPLFIAVIAQNLFKSKNNVDLYIKNIFICAGILSIICIFKVIFALASGHIYFRIGAAGTFSNPNSLAIFLVLTIPCIIYGMQSRIISKSLSKIVIALVICGILFTQSRKGFAGMLISFFLYFFLTKQYKHLFLLFILSSILIPIIIGFATFSHRFSQKNVIEHIEGKHNMVLAGWDMFKASPVIGHGYKGYNRLFSRYFPRARKRYSAHNIYITAIANYGIVGFIPFISIFLYPLFSAAKAIRGNNESTTVYSRQMAAICISSLAPFMLSGWFGGGLFYQPDKLFLLYSQVTFFLSAPLSEGYSAD
jgi:hypothetical protein